MDQASRLATRPVCSKAQGNCGHAPTSCIRNPRFAKFRISGPVPTPQGSQSVDNFIRFTSVPNWQVEIVSNSPAPDIS
jgi:hypothetical protein